jgi:hypothetical protein
MPSRANESKAREAEMVLPRVALEKRMRMMRMKMVVQAREPVASRMIWAKGRLSVSVG